MSDMLYDLNLKSGIAFLLLLIFGVALCHFGTVVWEGSIFDAQRYVVAGIGFLANFGIIYYHLTVPPHPKFLLLRKRKIMVRLHAGFGMLEVIIGVCTLITGSANLALVFGGLAFAHALTSLIQAPAVFGAKAIMIPSYFLAGCLHLYVGMQLMLNPSSPFWVMNTFLTVNIYAYVRVFMLLYEKTDLFRDNHYSISVLSAGVVVIPCIVGPAGPLYIFCYILVFLIIAKLIFGFSSQEMSELWKENVRVGLVNQQQKNEWLLKNVGDSIDATGISKETAQKIFNKLDSNNNGLLEPKEMSVFLEQWGVHNSALDTMMIRITKPIDFSRFFNMIKSTDIMQETFKKMQKNEADTDEDKARLIFNELDFDRSGYIERVELEMLLLEYGLPKREAVSYMDKYDTNGDKRISFEEFFDHFSPLWRFAYAL